jgi:hypothetical protein
MWLDLGILASPEGQIDRQHSPKSFAYLMAKCAEGGLNISDAALATKTVCKRHESGGSRDFDPPNIQKAPGEESLHTGLTTKQPTRTPNRLNNI